MSMDPDDQRRPEVSRAKRVVFTVLGVAAAIAAAALARYVWRGG